LLFLIDAIFFIISLPILSSFFTCAHMYPTSYFLPFELLVSSQQRNWAIIVYYRVSLSMWATEELLTGHRQVTVKLSTFDQLSLLTKTNNKEARPSH